MTESKNITEIENQKKYYEYFQEMAPGDYLLPQCPTVARNVVIEAMNDFHSQFPTMEIALLTKGNKSKGFVLAEEFENTVNLHPLKMEDLQVFAVFAGLHQPDDAEVDAREYLGDIFGNILYVQQAGVPVYDLDAMAEKKKSDEHKMILAALAGIFMLAGYMIFSVLALGGQNKEVRFSA